MGEIPGWIREQLRDEGWVVVESLETFDVHLGQRYANRAMAVHKGLIGDALLSSRGTASTSAELDEFFTGRLRRSAEPLASGDERLLVHSLDSVERHVKPPRAEAPAQTKGPSERHETRAWTCPGCRETWHLLAEEPDIPEDAGHCPDCAEPPSEFTPGQIVRVRQRNSGRTRLGVIDEPVQADYFSPDEDEVIIDSGPYTGEYMVWHLSEAYGSSAPADPDFEREVFGNLPTEPERRRGLASQLMMGTSAEPEQIQALEPEEEAQLSGA